MLRAHGRFVNVDPDNPRAFGLCARCQFRFNLHTMVWQWDYRGGPSPINTRILVCGRPSCLDVPQPQLSPVILSPDPPPLYNIRPENYFLEESSFLLTEDGSILTTESGSDLVTAIPNPANPASTVHLQCNMVKHAGSVATAYLDLFNGNPLGSMGVSVLAAITGSAVRPNIASQLTTTIGPTQTIATNPAALVVTTSSAAAINISYAALYTAASGGTLLMSGPLSVQGPPSSITAGVAVQFDPLALSINLT